MCFIIITSTELGCYVAVIVVVWLYGCFVPRLLSHLCVLQRKVSDGFCLHSSAQRMCLPSITDPSPAVYSIKLYLYSVCSNKIVFRRFNLHSLHLNTHSPNQFPAHNKVCQQQPLMISMKDVGENQNMLILPLRRQASIDHTAKDFYNSQLWAFLFYSKRELN